MWVEKRGQQSQVDFHKNENIEVLEGDAVALFPILRDRVVAAIFEFKISQQSRLILKLFGCCMTGFKWGPHA